MHERMDPEPDVLRRPVATSHDGAWIPPFTLPAHVQAEMLDARERLGRRLIAALTCLAGFALIAAG